jgi:lysophospholipase L1-like esterase
MPTGDSITEGADGDATYRYFLWHALVNAGYSVDLVGSMSGVRNGLPKYPDFDQNHEGHSGWRADRMANAVTNWATWSTPDIVLLHAGTNDLIQAQTVASTIVDLTNIVKRMRNVNPQTTFLIAQIIPIVGLEAQVQDFNREIAQLAAVMNKDNSRVVAVDLFTDFDPALDLKSDGIHPTETGFQKMASHWVEAVSPFLSASPPPPPPQSDMALFVVGNSTNLPAADSAVFTRLVERGLQVTLADDDLVSPADSVGRDLILIASTVNPDKIGTSFTATPVPVITWEGALYDDLGMTGTAPATDFGQSVAKKKVSIQQPSHVMAGGLGGTVLVADPAVKMTWGRPSSGGFIIANVAGFVGQPAIFGYDANVSMVTGTAPARRVGFLLNNTSALNLTANGWTLFDATVTWALG